MGSALPSSDGHIFLKQGRPIGRQRRRQEELNLASRDLVGRCGLYCGTCSIYRAYKDKGEYLKLVSEQSKCPPEKVRCEGCTALTPECWGSGCKIVQCLKEKGLEFCYECPEYVARSCEKYEKLAGGYLEKGEDMRANLERIRIGQTEEWLKECEKLYRCRACGRPLPLGRIKKTCYHCGTDLSQKA